MKLRNLIIAAAGLALTAGVGVSASAATPLQLQHPRRVEVNHRLEHLNRKIRFERREGMISPLKAHRMHARLHRTREQERQMAARDGGRLTRHDRVRLNREENGVHAHLAG
jgi:hypothetical protein